MVKNLLLDYLETMGSLTDFAGFAMAATFISCCARVIAPFL